MCIKKKFDKNERQITTYYRTIPQHIKDASVIRLTLESLREF